MTGQVSSTGACCFGVAPCYESLFLPDS